MQNRVKGRVWVSYGIAEKAAPNRAGRVLDANDKAAADEARALRTARGLAPARTRRYEDKDGQDIMHELIHGRR